MVMWKYTGLAIAAMVAAAGATVRAQDAGAGESAAQSVARAKLLADAEHDYEPALALAAIVGRDEKNGADVRAQAFVIAARCLSQLGKSDEARIQLQMAAQLGGPAAAEARRLLDAGQTDQQLELRIAKAIEELFSHGPDPLKLENLQSNQTARDLIWVGAPAVPRLAKVLADIDHLAYVTAAAFLLGDIGTAEAAAAIRAALQQSDPLYRRAVLRGFEPMTARDSHRKFWEGPVREAAVSLLKDRDSDVRALQLSEYSELMTVGELLAMSRDPEDKVRIGAWKALQGRCVRPLAVASEVDEIVAELRRCLKEDHDPVRRVACGLFMFDPIRRDADGRELAFESMLDPVLTGPDLTNLPRWMSAYDAMQASQAPLSRPIPIDLLVHVAERFDQDATAGANPPPRGAVNSINALSVWISRSAGIPIGQTERYGWPATERAKVWKLVRLGYGGSVNTWAQSNATAEDVPTIVENCVEAGEPALAGNLINQKFRSLTEEQRQSIARSLVRAIDTERVGLDLSDKYRLQRFTNWCLTLKTIGAESGDEALIRIAETKLLSPNDWVANALMTREYPAVELRLLPRLVVLPTNDTSSEPMRARNAALGRLAAAHSPELPKLLATCYGLGLSPSTVTGRGKSVSRPKGIAWMLTRDIGADAEATSRLLEERRAEPSKRKSVAPTFAAEWGPTYSEADVRVALEECARLEKESFWYDVKSAVDLLPVDGPFDSVAITLLEVATRLVASAVPAVNEGKEPHPVVGALLAHRAPGWEDLAVANVLDARWRDVVLNSLPEVTPGLLDRLASGHDPIGKSMRRSIVGRLATEKNPAIRARAPDFLKDEDPSVRQAAISATQAIMPERAFDLILPLAKDPNSSVRGWLCTCLGSIFDRRAIPVLVDRLEDPDNDVRVAAKSSLEALQYTFEQKEKWKRVLEGAGLETTSAAEALVKQAAAGQPKATRLVAIESLGTLGVAETLPVLIQFMGDGDAEIAAAAKEAVARINRRAADGKDTDAAKSGKDGKKPSDQ